MPTYHVYILCNRPKGTLYIGSTSNIEVRLAQHKAGTFDGFTKQYAVTHLVYIEETSSAYAAVSRERQLKNWRRQWKINQIESLNPHWNYLGEDNVTHAEASIGDCSDVDPETSSG